MAFNYYIPTRILFGQGFVQKLHQQQLPGKKALIVISNGKSTRANGYLDIVTGQLDTAGVAYTLFDQIQPNPSKDNVMDGAAAARANGCDFVIGLGGGSSMDASKAIALMATNDGDYWDYIGGGTGNARPVQNNPLPIVTITTTAGTGSEADAWTVVTNEETNEKISFGGTLTFPTLSIVDTDFMKSVPPKYTAFQGFDAFFHNAEGYISKATNLMSDMYAITGLQAVGCNLARAVENGNDMQAREMVAFGNTVAGFVMSVGGLTSQHALEHALSAFHSELSHGAGLIMLSRAYFTHYANVGACDERMIAMAKAIGNEQATQAMDFVDALASLQAACGVDQLKMSDYGIVRNDLGKYLQCARETMGRLFKNDPVTLSDEDVMHILENSYR